MTDSPHMRPDAFAEAEEGHLTEAPEPPTEDIVHFLMVENVGDSPDGAPDATRVNIAPVRYDMALGPLAGASLLKAEDIDGGLREFVDTTLDDMMCLSFDMVMNNAERQKTSGKPDTRDQLYVRLLASMGKHPVELMANLLVANLHGAIEEALADPEFDQTLAQWKASATSEDSPDKG